MHSVFRVDPSIWGVRFLSSNHVEGGELTQSEPPAPGAALDCRPQVLERLSAAQPLLALDTPLVPLLPKPGGGPRFDLPIGAPHSSEVTAVGGGAESPQVLLELQYQ